MKFLHPSALLLVCMLLFHAPAHSQFSSLKPTLLQPNDGSQVVVPGTSVAGLDFDWQDVSGATYYLFELMHTLDGGGTQVSSMTSTVSRLLYSSGTLPLVPGTSSSPGVYRWKVTAYKGTTASQTSDERSFALIGGTLTNPAKPAAGDNPPNIPTSLSPVEGIEYTISGINKNGVLMQWDPVSNAAAYEVQLVRARDEDDNEVEKIHYRMDVSSTQAMVTNLTLFGTYRFEVRSISSLNSRSISEATSEFQVVQFQASDIYPESPDADGVIDEYDLFSLALDWHRYVGGVGTPQAVNPQSNIVSADKFVEQADLVAFLIQFTGSIQKFPSARPTPTPVQLDVADLYLPEDGASFTLSENTETVSFSWSEVTNAERYTIRIYNESTFESFDFATYATEVPLTGQWFEGNLGGEGNYKWQILADADGFIQSKTEERSFVLTLNYTKSGKAVNPVGSWMDNLLGFLIGEAAEAAEPIANKDDVVLASPTVLFPFSGQVITTTSPFPLIWAEVPNATTYAVEIRIPGLAYFNLVDHVLDSKNLNYVTDDVVGDGIVSASFFKTFRSTNYQLRVQARTQTAQSSFSNVRQFAILPTGVLPYVNIDYSGNGDYEGTDVLMYSSFWRTKKGETRYDETADLMPSSPNGLINASDLISFVDYFHDRASLPRYPLIEAPILLQPENGSFFGPESVGQNITFSWSTPSEGIENLLAWEMELTLPGDSSTVTKQFLSISSEYVTRFSMEGFYSWRVRAIDTEGNRGDWSPSFAFAIELDQYQPELPEVVAPVDDAVFTNGVANFEWSRVTRGDSYGVFDRLEIQNGNGPIVALDIYHRHSDLGTETVLNSVPLAPNFGPDFRWRVSTIYVIRDSFYRLYMNKPAEVPEWHSFTLKTSSKALTGLGAWSPDLDWDGHVNLIDAAQFQHIWRLERNGSPEFIQEADFNLDAKIGPEDAVLLGGYGHQGYSTSDSRSPAPVATFPLEPTSGNPPVILASYAQSGITATWGQLTGFTKYLVEWIDSEDGVHGLYSTKMPAPDLISPLEGEVISLPTSTSTLTLTFTVVPDAAQYSAVLTNVNTSQYHAFIVDAGDPSAETFSIQVSRDDLDSYVGGAGTYEYRVSPFAPGCFSDTSIIETFAVSYTKDSSDYYSTSQPIVKSKPPIVQEGNGVLPAFSYYGLYSWRVMGMADDYALSKPTAWNRFGIQCLGPAYGEEAFCGQEEPGP